LIGTAKKEEMVPEVGLEPEFVAAVEIGVSRLTEFESRSQIRMKLSHGGEFTSGIIPVG